MSKKTRTSVKSYQNNEFLNSTHARELRILAEYLEPESRFARYQVDDTIVFFGSARYVSREQAEKELENAKHGDGDLEQAKMGLETSQYYEAAREMARRLTDWSKNLADDERRFVVCTGGGPGIMEAANRGASEAKGVNIGLTISLPAEEPGNSFITRELSLHFHYFFMRKFWFAYLAKALIVFPGGFGTLDELFELLTLLQTRKISKHLPIVLFGTKYWDEVINFDALIRYGSISPGDLSLFYRTDSVDEACEFVIDQLSQHALEQRGAIL
jgi:uncharacterized protein (TIGR00730 family)